LSVVVSRRRDGEASARFAVSTVDGSK